MALYIVPITSKDQQGYISWIAVACGGRKDLWQVLHKVDQHKDLVHKTPKPR